MAKTKKKSVGFKLPEELISQRVAFAASGAAGVHEDQRSNKRGVGKTNRVGSRSSMTRQAVREGW